MVSRSPTAVTPLPKTSSAPETPAREQTTSRPQQQPVPFPSPQTFDIIPPLHGLLLRLLSSTATGPSDGTRVGEPNLSQSQDQQQPVPAHSETAALGNAPPPLDVKDLPTEASSVKIRIQKAQAVVEGLPDVHRSVEDQEQEIGELEGRIAKLKSAISDFGNRAGS